jgi:mannose-1-phosphate guanylyltransferase
MIQQTVSRLLPLAPVRRFWVISNEDLRREILRQLPRVKPAQVVAEPVGRNTAPAIGLAAFLLLQSDPEAVIGMFPSDHVIGDESRFRQVLEKGIEIASSGENIVVLGIRPTRPETGYGYIEAGSQSQLGEALRVRRFTEKPDGERAAAFLSAGNYFWNSGMFLWSARTLATALEEHLPKTATILKRIAGTYGTHEFAGTFKKLYSKC